MIIVDDLTFHYKVNPIFTHFNWNIDKGETWSILGPSGCGKSTLLALLAGLRFSSAGGIIFDGEKLLRPRPKTGLILQDYGLLPWSNVRQNVNLGMRLREYYGADGVHAPKEKNNEANVDSMLEKLGLLGVSEKYPGQLSGGQRQRVAIARTLVLNPDLLLMDEPFSSLDAPTRELLQQLVLDLKNEQDLTIILVTHSIEEAALLGKKILLLSNPPNQIANIIENPGAGNPEFRNSDPYIQLCKLLRVSLSETKIT